MTTLPANPLGAIVARAAKTLPVATGATQRAIAERSRPQVRVALADVSGSMAGMAGRRRRIDVLQEALDGLNGWRIVGFCDRITEVASGGMLPSPGGGTALDLALTHIAAAAPTHVLVVSDGHPDNPAAALAAADRLSARIDVVYCGPEGDHKGMSFMRRLARGGGQARHHDLTRAPERLAAAVRSAALIEGPKSK